MKLKRILSKCYHLVTAIPNSCKKKKKRRVKIVNNGAVLKKCKIVSAGENNTIILAKGGHYTNCAFLMYGSNGTVRLGADCIGTDAEFFIEDKDGSIEVGDKTSFCGRIQLAVIEGRTIRIGKDCLFSSDISLRTGDSHSLLDLEGRRKTRRKISRSRIMSGSGTMLPSIKA